MISWEAEVGGHAHVKDVLVDLFFVKWKGQIIFFTNCTKYDT